MKDQDNDFIFGRFLKFWRAIHDLSQEGLSELVGCSARHISRIEQGSSRPSEELVLQIARVLKLGKRDLNHILIAAGYSSQEEKRDFHSPELKWLRKAMLMTVKALDPYPAAVVDELANISLVNRAWVGFFSQIVSPDELASMGNLYEFIFSRKAKRNIVHNWEDTISVILMSLQQAALFSDSSRSMDTLDRLQKYPSVPEDWQQRASHIEPMASFRIQVDINGQLEKFYSVSTMVGAVGSSAFASEPKMSVVSFYPESDEYDVDSFVKNNIQHPCLLY